MSHAKKRTVIRASSIPPSKRIQETPLLNAERVVVSSGGYTGTIVTTVIITAAIIAAITIPTILAVRPVCEEGEEEEVGGGNVTCPPEVSECGIPDWLLGTWDSTAFGGVFLNLTCEGEDGRGCGNPHGEQYASLEYGCCGLGCWFDFIIIDNETATVREYCPTCCGEYYQLDFISDTMFSATSLQPTCGFFSFSFTKA